MHPRNVSSPVKWALFWHLPHLVPSITRCREVLEKTGALLWKWLDLRVWSDPGVVEGALGRGPLLRFARVAAFLVTGAHDRETHRPSKLPSSGHLPWRANSSGFTASVSSQLLPAQLCAEPLVLGWQRGPGFSHSYPWGPSNWPLPSLPLTALHPACKTSEGYLMTTFVTSMKEICR